MYGGYDGSASQFAGQGGFLPTPAGGATAGADGAAGGAVRTLERRSSRRVSRPRRTSRGGDDPARSRLPPDRYRATRACDARARRARFRPSGLAMVPAMARKRASRVSNFLGTHTRLSCLPSSPVTARPGSRGVPRAPHREAAGDLRQRLRRGACAEPAEPTGDARVSPPPSLRSRVRRFQTPTLERSHRFLLSTKKRRARRCVSDRRVRPSFSPNPPRRRMTRSK